MSYPKRLGITPIKALGIPSIYEMTRQEQRNYNERRNQSRILQIEILKKPKNFSEQLEFRIKTDLPDNETVKFAIMDSDSIFSNKPDDKADAELAGNNSLRLGIAKYVTRFMEDMQKKAFADTEFDTAECYIKISHPKVGTVYSEVFDVREYDFKKETLSKNICSQIVPRLNLTEQEKKKFISTVLCESQLGNDRLNEIAWVYYNRVHLYGLDSKKGLNASNPYRKKSADYKLCSYYYKIDNESYIYANIKYGDFTIKQYLETKDFKQRVEPKFKKMEKFIRENVFIDKPETCFKDWIGQGYWGDLDMNPEDPNNKIHDPKWYMARQYYWLQIQKKVSTKYVHIMKAGNGTTFIFDEIKIEDYFKKNPHTLTEAKDVRKFRTEENILDFD